MSIIMKYVETLFNHLKTGENELFFKKSQRMSFGQ